MIRKIVSMLTAAAMAMSCTFALAENTKHETVWAVTDGEGSVRYLTDTVRLENGDGSAEMTDRTMLTDIENISGTQTWKQEGETLIWQADGKDITYRGTSDRPLPVVPVVEVRLDGSEISAADLKDKTGSAEIHVTYRTSEQIPFLAATVLLLPETGVSDLQLENASLIRLGDRQAVLGWGVPGAEEALSLPISFTIRFNSDHASAGWMMTLVSGDPVDMIFREADKLMDFDPQEELTEAVSLLTSIKNGETIAETKGKTGGIPEKINTLNDGLKTLNDGAQTLATGAGELSTGAASAAAGASTLSDGAKTLYDGTVTLSEGADTLNTGLATLSAGSATLNEGADAIFAAILNTANQQIAASGLAAQGMEIPQLTAENYQEALGAVMAQLDPEKVKETARTQVEAIVRPKVEAGLQQIREAVTAEAEKQVLGQVLTAAGVEMDAEQYQAAVRAGKVPADKAGLIQGAVETQMAGDEVKKMIEAAVTEQLDKLVAENVEKALSSDETVTAALAQAQSAYESLQGLKAQLDQVQTFVTGVKTYTAGVDQASAGAAELSTGAASLKTGAETLSTGMSDLSTGLTTLSDGAATVSAGATSLHDEGTDTLQASILGAEKTAAEKLLPILTGDVSMLVRLLEENGKETGRAGYDLRPEEMKTSTVFIIRTELD